MNFRKPGEPSDKLVTRISRWIVHHPWISIFISCIFIFSLIPGLLYFEEKHDVRIWFKETDPNIKYLDQFERKFGNDENVVVVVHSPSGIFDQESISVVRDITEEMWLVKQVLRVDSITNYNWTYAEGDDIIVEPFISDDPDDAFLEKRKKEALSDTVMPGYIISEDGKTALIYARLVTTLGDSPNYKKIVEDTRAVVEKFKNKGDHKFFVTGEAAVNDSFREISNYDIMKIIPVMYLFIIIFLIYSFKSFKAMLQPLVVIFASMGTTLGLCFYMGLKYNTILAILPGILISISIADSVHLIMSYLFFRGMGEGKREATFHSLQKNFVPTLLTSLSTMIGFFSLMIADLVPIRQLGLLAGAGTFFAWLITIFLLGPLLVLVNLKISDKFKQKNSSEEPSEFSLKYLSFIKRNMNKILGGFTAVSLICLVITMFNQVNSNPYEYFREHIHLKQAYEFIKKNVGGNAGPEIVISSGEAEGLKDPEFLRKVEEFKNWLHSLGYVNSTIDIIDVVKRMNRSLHGDDQKYYTIPDNRKQIAEELFLYTMSLPQGMDLNNRMSLDNKDMRMTVLWSIFDTRGWLAKTDIILNKAKEMNLDLAVTGKFLLYQRMMGYVVYTFFSSITMAFVLVAIMMMIVFKSVKIGILSLIPNIIPLFIGGAVMKLGGIDLNVGSALVASVSLGIAVDDTIHFLANYYRLTRSGMNEEKALANIFTFTGKALIVTTLILATSFFLFVFGDFIPNIHFGVLCASILTFALIVDIVFLPALLLKISEIKKRKANA